MDSTNFSGVILAGLLLLFGIGQSRSLWLTLQSLSYQKESMKKDEFRFLWKQTRRRFQASVLFGLSGIGMLAGFHLPPERFPVLFVTLWILALILLLWGILLTAVDFFAIRFYYAEKRRNHEAEKIGLEYLLRTSRSPKIDNDVTENNPENPDD